MLDHARPVRARMVTILVAVSVSVGACSADAPTTDPSAPATGADTGAATEAPTPTTSASDAGDGVTPIDGIYRSTVTEADARAAGIGPGRFSEVVGDYELDLVRGQVHVLFTHTINSDGLIGSYTVDGDSVRFVAGDGSLHETFRWSLDHGALQLTLLKTDQPGARVYDELVFGTDPWERHG
jgi:hypothetical protein